MVQVAHLLYLLCYRWCLLTLVQVAHLLYLPNIYGLQYSSVPTNPSSGEGCSS